MFELFELNLVNVSVYVICQSHIRYIFNLQSSENIFHDPTLWYFTTSTNYSFCYCFEPYLQKEKKNADFNILFLFHN